ncbi:hypothetical protein D3C87_1863970 [compost metagenome]
MRFGGSRFRLEARSLCPALVRARELLHHADGPHRHEVPAERELVRPVHRDVVESELEDRIRQLAGGDRHLHGCLDSATRGFGIARMGGRERDGFLEGKRRGGLRSHGMRHCQAEGGRA